MARGCENKGGAMQAQRSALSLRRVRADRVLSILLLILVALPCGGCAKEQFLKRSTVSTTELSRIHDRYIVADVYRAYRALDTPARKRDYRDEVVYARMRYVNAHYEVLVRELHYGRASKDFAVDLVELTLDAVGALAGTAATKAILHAISGGLIGANAAFDRSFYQDQASFVIVQKMDELRDDQMTKITNKLRLPAVSQNAGPAYGFSEAMEDIDELMRSGSLTRAVLELSKSAGADAKEASDDRKSAENAAIEAAIEENQ